VPYELEVMCDDGNLCGEGPIWDAHRRRLLWVDAESALVYGYHPPEGRRETLIRSHPVSGIALNRDHALVLVGGAGAYLFRPPGRFFLLADRHGGEELVFNDCLADPKGRLYAGTYYWNDGHMIKTGALYLLDTDGSLEMVDEGFEIANGLGLSPDGRTLYFADSGARTIYAYEVDAATGRPARRRSFVRVPAEEGIPDGLAVDSEGYVWSAQWYGGAVVRYDPEGREERRIALPVKQVSSVAFGGPSLTDLYVTSARRYWPSPHLPPGFDAGAPMGGALYRLRTEIQGRLEYLAAMSEPPGSLRQGGDAP
jgi:sugar lactone lactonase YvrE